MAVLALVAPARTNASAPADCLNAFGQRHPAVWCDPTFVGAVSPTDNPFGYGLKGLLYVRGVTTPGAAVRVDVTDGVLTVVQDVTASVSADPEAHKPAGAFDAELKVTDLGVHQARGGAAPDSTDPSDRGPSQLLVSTLATDPVTGAVTSMRTTVTKYAASYLDAYPAALTGPLQVAGFEPPSGTPRFPPRYWCRVLGAVYRTVVRSCCVPFQKRDYCDEGQGPFATPSTGRVSIEGVATDDTTDNYYIGSEIADARLTVTQGDKVLIDRSVLRARQGPQAWWSYSVSIENFLPNIDHCQFLWDGIFGSGFEIDFDTSGCYRFTITVTDAWGNVSTADSGFVAVLPV